MSGFLLDTNCISELGPRLAGTDRWGLLAAEAKSKGTPLAIVDGLLAATALHHNLTIVSRNARDLAGARASVFNPWKE